jgi:siroheme synthase-like protein
MKPQYMPISVSMKGRKCLVVGGGAVALRKVENLLDYEAEVTVVAPSVHAALREHAEQGRITLQEREYAAREAADYGMVIAATDDGALNQRVYDDATSRGVLVNVVDDTPRCDFIVPAVLRRDCLAVAITTDGKAPFLAGHLHLILDDVFPRHWERLVQYAAEFRRAVRTRWPEDLAKRRLCYNGFLEADWKKMIAEMDEGEIREELSRMVEQPVCEAAR